MRNTPSVVSEGVGSITLRTELNQKLFYSKEGLSLYSIMVILDRCHHDGTFKEQNYHPHNLRHWTILQRLVFIKTSAKPGSVIQGERWKHRADRSVHASTPLGILVIICSRTLDTRETASLNWLPPFEIVISHYQVNVYHIEPRCEACYFEGLFRKVVSKSVLSLTPSAFYEINIYGCIFFKNIFIKYRQIEIIDLENYVLVKVCINRVTNL